MLTVLGKNYYIDIESITEKCMSTVTAEPIKDSEGNEEKKGIEVNLFKYETIKICIEVVLSELENVDEEIAEFSQANLPISFKVAFNTLLKNEIIIEDEDE